MKLEVDQGAPKGSADFAGPLWRDLIKHACSEANRLGLEININNDAGWCGSGGPWITPDLSMQRIVWPEIEVNRPKALDTVVPKPKATKDFYRDIALFAYPTSANDCRLPGVRGKSGEKRQEILLRATFPTLPQEAVVPRDRMVDLTARMGADGRIAWDVPTGKRTLLRIGHTTTGKDNHPAPEAGRGLECDKLSKEGIEAHFNGLMAKLIADNKPLVPKTLAATHVYGKPILGAEAFTATDQGKWQGHPASIKDLGDWAFCEGINRFVFHRYALQPWRDVRPGMSMGPWGLHYERTQTWWEQSRPWHEYLARRRFLLQQGLFVADLCFLTPETSPHGFRSPAKTGRERPGYGFDGCPPGAVLTRMSVEDGRLVLPDGMSYRMLVLPQGETMTPQLLRKIGDLVQSGAMVLGMPPVKSPSLSGYPQCDGEVKALARELWGDGEPPAELAARPVGKGRVIRGREIERRQAPTYEMQGGLGAAKWIWFNKGRPAGSALPATRCFRRGDDIGRSADPPALCVVTRSAATPATGRAWTVIQLARAQARRRLAVEACGRP